MITLFDSHAHFSNSSIIERQEQINRAKAEGFAGIIAVGGSQDLDASAIAATREYPGFVYLALGLDRDFAPKSHDPNATLISALKNLKKLILETKDSGVPVVAIGEIGLDYSRALSQEKKDLQKALFAEQLALAGELNLPVSIHSRDAADDTIAIIGQFGSIELRRQNRLGVLHCFTGNRDFADEAISLGLHISASGIITFQNAEPLRAVFKSIPEDRLLIETDCPYLAPAPLRGCRNEPAYMVHTARRLADIRSVTVEEIADKTTQNALRLFKI